MDNKLQMDFINQIASHIKSIINRVGPYSVIIFLWVQVISSCAPQGTVQYQNNQLEVLEKRVAILEQDKFKTLAELKNGEAEFQKKILKKVAVFKKSQQFFIAELNTLKNDISLITNDNEKAQFNIRKNIIKIKKLEKRLGDQSIALDELHKFFKSGMNTTKMVSSTEQNGFKKGFQFFKNKNFIKAISVFTQFREKHANSELSDDALYFIAYIHFLNNRYEQASLKFFEFLGLYPKSNRINDAKWWLGVSLERSGDLSGAIDFYQELTKLNKQDPLRTRAEFRLEELNSQTGSK